MSPDGTTGPFRRSDRLLDSRDFRRVLRRGRRLASGDLVVVTAKRPEKTKESEDLPGSRNRIGITVGRKVGNAVVRNRFKRRVREWFRAHRDELGSDLDLVVIARPSGGHLRFAELDVRLRDLLGLAAGMSVRTGDGLG